MNIFNLFFMLRIATKHWVALLLAAIITGTSVFCYFNFLTTPKYSATGSIIVTNGAIIVGAENGLKNGTSDYTDVATSLNFAETVADILKMPNLYKELAHATGDKYNFHQLSTMAKVERRSDSTLFFDITFTTTDPAEAIYLVNQYLDITPDYIAKIVNNSASTTQKAEAAVELLSNTITLTIMAAFAGAAVVYLIIFLIYSSDSIIRDEESFRERFDLPIIGVIPDFANAKHKEDKYYRYNRYYGYGGNKYAK